MPVPIYVAFVDAVSFQFKISICMLGCDIKVFSRIIYNGEASSRQDR